VTEPDPALGDRCPACYPAWSSRLLRGLGDEAHERLHGVLRDRSRGRQERRAASGAERPAEVGTVAENA
jgi:hypothetical protein